MKYRTQLILIIILGLLTGFLVGKYLYKFLQPKMDNVTNIETPVTDTVVFYSGCGEVPLETASYYIK